MVFLESFEDFKKDVENELGPELVEEMKKSEEKNSEKHLPFYNYCGPGTKVVTRVTRGDKGINQLDSACELHDVEYMAYADDDKKLRESDKKLVAAAKEYGGISGWLVEKAFALKNKAEDWGLFKPKTFTKWLASSDIGKQKKVGRWLLDNYLSKKKKKVYDKNDDGVEENIN